MLICCSCLRSALLPPTHLHAAVMGASTGHGMSPQHEGGTVPTHTPNQEHPQEGTHRYSRENLVSSRLLCSHLNSRGQLPSAMHVSTRRFPSRWTWLRTGSVLKYGDTSSAGREKGEGSELPHSSLPHSSAAAGPQPRHLRCRIIPAALSDGGSQFVCSPQCSSQPGDPCTWLLPSPAISRAYRHQLSPSRVCLSCFLCFIPGCLCSASEARSF